MNSIKNICKLSELKENYFGTFRLKIMTESTFLAFGAISFIEMKTFLFFIC
jgi:hypothetical protein